MEFARYPVELLKSQLAHKDKVTVSKYVKRWGFKICWIRVSEYVEDRVSNIDNDEYRESKILD